MVGRITLDEAYDKAISNDDRELIGTKKEKVLHKTIKYYICPDESFHEVKVKKQIGVLYADILIENQIYEIQTRSFNLLKDKLSVFLDNYHVTIVHPICFEKTIYKIDKEKTQIRKSPKKGSPFQIFVELYKIKSFLKEKNLDILILMIDMDEYRKTVEKKHYKSSGFERIVQIPKELKKEISLKSKKDYCDLLDNYNLPLEFTLKDFQKATRLSYKEASTSLNVLTFLEVVEKIGKVKNAILYKKTAPNH